MWLICKNDFKKNTEIKGNDNRKQFFSEFVSVKIQLKANGYPNQE